MRPFSLLVYQIDVGRHRRSVEVRGEMIRLYRRLTVSERSPHIPKTSPASLYRTIYRRRKSCRSPHFCRLAPCPKGALQCCGLPRCRRIIIIIEVSGRAQPSMLDETCFF